MFGVLKGLFLYIYSTAALDGESNLKEASALKKTQVFNTPAEITQIRCYCEVQGEN
jgi:hypothetical protein